MTNDHARARAGLLLGLGAYLMWGVLPLYFKAIGHVPATEVVAHRIVWSLVFLAALATLWKRWGGIREAIINPKVLGTLALTACLIGTNWLIWIWAVLNGHVLEGSLGYYLNPLVNVLLGTILLKEKLSRGQMFAVLLAAAGVAVLAAGAGGGLWISLSLAASFALYGYWRGDSGIGTDAITNILLILAGAITAIPLLLFTAAAKRLPYSTLGFLQYIAPSMQFLLAVLVFGEKLTLAHIVCFGAIWTALVIFAFEGVRTSRAGAKARREAERVEACPEPCIAP
jgi:chloramphenicol-sensitive protein RarD